jgi:hypothetical protein
LAICSKVFFHGWLLVSWGPLCVDGLLASPFREASFFVSWAGMMVLYLVVTGGQDMVHNQVQEEFGEFNSL